MIAKEPRRRLALLKRELRNSPQYRLLSGDGETVLGRADFLAALHCQSPLAAQLDQLIDQGQLIKHDGTSTVARATVGDREVVIKRHNKSGALQFAKMLVTKTRAESGFFRALLLRELGVPTPEPLLYCVTRKHGVAAINYLVSSCSPGDPLGNLFDQGRISSAAWQQAMGQTRHILDTLHSQGITHGDVKTPNLLFDGEHVDIVDLDPLRIHRCRALFIRRRRKDLEAFQQRVAGYPHRNGVK